MTEREKHIEMAQRLGLVGMRPHLDGIYIDALAAFARLVADDARATPALPQGVEEWVEKNAEYSDRVYECHAKYQSMKKYVAVDDLMNLLSGMAIVPVEPTDEMVDYAERMDWSIPDSRAVVINIWQAMLAATKENGE